MPTSVTMKQQIIYDDQKTAAGAVTIPLCLKQKNDG